METYKNCYSVKEDEMLWELHEIRHKLHNELIDTPLSEFNTDAKDFFENWKKTNHKMSQVILPESK